MDLGRVPGAAARGRSPSTSTASRSGRSSTRPGRACPSTRCSTASGQDDAPYVLAFCDGGYTTNLPLEDVTDGKAWVAYGYDGEPLEPEHGGPARLLVPHLYFWKSAKWVRGLALRDEDEPGFWEIVRLPQLRRPVARAAVLGRLSLAGRHRRGGRRRDAPRPDARARRPGLAGPPRRPARRRPADRGGRLPGRARATRSPRRPASRVAITVERLDDGEVSPYLTEELRAGRRARAARADRRLLRLGRRRTAGPLLLVAGGSGVVPLMAMLRHRRAAGSDVPARLLYSSRTLEDVIYRAELDEPSTASRSLHTLTREQPAGLDRLRAARRRGAARRGRLAGRRRTRASSSAARRRSSRPSPAALVELGYPPAASEDRTVRSDGRTMMDALDGNAIGGLLLEVFGAELTAVAGRVRELRRAAAGGRARRLPARARDRRALPELRQRADDVRRGARRLVGRHAGVRGTGALTGGRALPA